LRLARISHRRANEFCSAGLLAHATADCSVTVCACGIEERGLALAAGTPPVEPTRRLAQGSVAMSAEWGYFA